MELTLGEENITTFKQAVERVSGVAHAKLPETLHGHLERATALVLHRHVWLGEDGRHAQVLSSDGQTWYRVNGNCTCLDAPRAPQGMCKHKLAVMLYKRAGEVLTSAAARPGLTNAEKTCPEALFSACLRGTVRGIDTQLTARGMTLEAFQRNFDAVHALFDVPAPRLAGAPTPQSAAQTPASAPICPVHGPMKESSKAPGTWFCSKKLFDGSYCKERMPK
jgi:hypothetical protein